MSRITSTAITLALLAGGAALWTAGAAALHPDDSFHFTPNPLGIKRSPYGKVLAMAMQGPIDAYWHAATCEDPDHCELCKAHNHHHHDGDDHDDHDAPAAGANTPNSPALRLQAYLDNLDSISRKRTNPRSPSDAHKFYLRRQIEDKLRFAYELDPSHYGNYNSYHLFLTEPQLGTRPSLTKEAAHLAEQTVDYCLHESNDPRPALTAASAASNILELLFLYPEHHTLAEMKHELGVIDGCLARFRELSATWRNSGLWDNLSEIRREEISDRYHFLSRVRDASDATIRRLESRQPAGQVAN